MLLKKCARKEVDNQSEGVERALICCRKLGRRRFIKNSCRPNYDDLNEHFWRPECLQLVYHNLDPARGVHTMSHVDKTFREKASWPAISLSFWRWLAFLAVSFHALVGIGAEIVAAGGVNITGIVKLNPLKALVAASYCFITVGIMQFLLCIISGWHAMPFGSDSFSRDAARTVSLWGFVKLLYSLGWLGGLVFIGNAKALIGSDLTAIWLILVAAKAGVMVIAEGAFMPAGCSRRNPLRRIVQDLEGVYFVSHDNVGKDDVLGPKYMRQPVSRKVGYFTFWLLLLLVKLTFDLQVITQQVRLVVTLQNAKTLNYVPFWNFSLLGYLHPVAVIGSWSVTFILCMLDSYIAFTLGAPLLGYFVLAKDGVGSIRKRREVKTAFSRGVGWFNRTPLAAQFVKMCMPLAGAQGQDPNSVFRRVWDQFVMSLREQDLVSNEEQCKLLYSDAVTNVPNALPLFMYAGRVRSFIERARKTLHAAHSSTSDAEFLHKAVGNDVTAEALAEILAAVPCILTLICQSHSAIGFGDQHVGEAIRDLFRPAHGQSVRDCVASLLEAEDSPQGTLKKLGGQFAQLMVEFEKDSASTRLRGSPLITCTIKVLRHMHRLWSPPDVVEEDRRAAAAAAAAAAERQAGRSGTGRSVNQSFAGVTLEAIAGVASRDGGDISPSIPGLTSPAYHDSLMDSRSIPGIIKLLQTPNEASGRLDGDGDEAISQLYESLRDASRRVFYLLTMVESDSTLTVPEAERRVVFFMNSLFMHQLPAVYSVLEMPSFSAITPQYNEAVIYGKNDFLTVVNRHGVSPLIYLKALHAAEWANFLERLGVRNESEAWAAKTDACGASISGEVEVRLWASHRGQTLSRTGE